MQSKKNGIGEDFIDTETQSHFKRRREDLEESIRIRHRQLPRNQHPVARNRLFRGGAIRAAAGSRSNSEYRAAFAHGAAWQRHLL